ncbi:hypothetical protein UPYG_G00131210 [Umbra pygmaea]|uniref:Uncharacterized protein n=1 Tax=Umbra pygmaea TaxID=75934 RepID=A0ABD0WXN2_UMBPY
MPQRKVVVKCGNYAVLVDLCAAVTPGETQDSHWFTIDHTKEVSSLVREAVDQRVRLYVENLHKRGQPKHKKALPPAKPFCTQGSSCSLVVNFLKRHVNLWCVVQKKFGELRVFPERCVVSVCRPADTSVLHGNPTPAMILTMDAAGQSIKSQYFSRTDRRAVLNSSIVAKRSALSKMAKQANIQKDQNRPCPQDHPGGSTFGEGNPDQRPFQGEQVPGTGQITTAVPRPWASGSIPREQNTGMGQGSPKQAEGKPVDLVETPGQSHTQEPHLGAVSQVSTVLGDPPHLHAPGRVCVGSSSRQSQNPPLPPGIKPNDKAESQHSSGTPPSHLTPQPQTTEELLTPGNQEAPGPPSSTSNYTEQTIQNSPPATLSGRSVNQAADACFRPASTELCPGGACGGRNGEKRESRRADKLGEEGREHRVRPSRLRRLKK